MFQRLLDTNKQKIRDREGKYIYLRSLTIYLFFIFNSLRKKYTDDGREGFEGYKSGNKNIDKIKVKYDDRRLFQYNKDDF